MSGESRIEYWNERWEAQQIGFHKMEVHSMLTKHMDKLCVEGKKPGSMFVPLCGKTLDMKWLSDQGIPIVGLDGVQSALEQFYTEHNIQWDYVAVPALGPQGGLLQAQGSQIKLYCGDMMELSPDITGLFDAVWDRGSLVAINREDVSRYVSVMKSSIKSGGRILIELLQYDPKIMDDVVDGPTKPPPPHPMYEKDIKALYEPEFTVEQIDEDPRKLMGKDITACIMLLVKK